MKVILSVVALYNYDNTLFNSMSLPEGVDGAILIDSIFAEAGELPVMYPDAVLFKRLLTSWSTRKLPLWTRYKAAIDAEYDLLHNYDRTEIESVEKELEGERERTNTGTVSTNGTLEQDGTITDVYSDDATVEHTGTQKQQPATTQTTNVNAYNASALVPSGTIVMSGDDTRTDNLKDTTKDDSTNTKTLDTIDTTHNTVTNDLTEHEEHNDIDTTERSLRAYGNIGVTSSQDMVNQELDLIPRLDIYKIITDDFIDAFCIGIY